MTMRTLSCPFRAAAIAHRALLITLPFLLLVPMVNSLSSTPSQTNEIPQSFGRTHTDFHYHSHIPTPLNSPEWRPFYHRLLSTPTLADLLSGVDGPASSSSSSSRNLQSSEVDELNTPCNEVLDTISLSELTEIMASIVNVLAPSGSVQNLYLQSLLVNNLKTGIQVIQVCGSCTESIPNLDNHQDYCGSNHYGNDRLHSGLLLIPTTMDGNSTTSTSTTGTTDTPPTILPGTHVGYIYNRATVVSLSAEPSLLWMGRQDSHPVIWIYSAVASAQSVVFLAPHNMGYGKSADLYKAYFIRRGYETSIIPLWYQSQTLVQELSGGCAALANAAIVAGYSEGGYTSVVVANALYQNAGVDIIQVQTGGAPYKTSSAAMLGLFQSMLAGTLPTEGLRIAGLLGASYSSTYPDLPNFNTSQDMLSSINGTRDLLVNALTGIADPQVVEALLANLTQNGILDILRPAFVAAVEQFLADGIADPCSNSTMQQGLVDLEMDLLCAAFVENDLTILLEEQIEYPVEFCQSPDDDIVSVNNLPSNLDSSEFFTQVDGVTGDHYTAAETCFFHVLSTAMTSSPATTYAVEALHDPQCDSTSSSGGGNSSAATPTMAPTVSTPDSEPSSSSVSSILPLDKAVVSGMLLFPMAVFYMLQLLVV